MLICLLIAGVLVVWWGGVCCVAALLWWLIVCGLFGLLFLLLFDICDCVVLRFCVVLVDMAVFDVYEFDFWLLVCDGCGLIYCVAIDCSLLLLVVLI